MPHPSPAPPNLTQPYSAPRNPTQPHPAAPSPTQLGPAQLHLAPFSSTFSSLWLFWVVLAGLLTTTQPHSAPFSPTFFSLWLFWGGFSLTDKQY